MSDDKEVFLNQLPLVVGYKVEFVFGKCLYQITVEDMLIGMTDENDLIWVSRISRNVSLLSNPFRVACCLNNQTVVVLLL